MADCDGGPAPELPGAALLPPLLPRPGAALLRLHQRPVEGAEGGDTGGALALAVVLWDGQEVLTTDLNRQYVQSNRLNNTKNLRSYFVWSPALKALERV